MGKPGCGKTYICSAITAWMYGKVSNIFAFKESRFFEKIRAAMDMIGDYRQEIQYQCDHELFIYDDLGSTGQGQTGWRQEVIFEMVNIRYESQRPTVITTNFNVDQLASNLGGRTYSRLMSSENVIIDMFSYPDLRLPQI